MSIHTCGRCGALVEKDARTCPSCGRAWPALFGLRRPLDRIFGGDRSWSRGAVYLLVLVYIAVTMVAQARGDVGGGLFGRLTAGPETMIRSGALYLKLLLDGHWWLLITACFLHFGPIHLLFNAVALWQLGPLLEAAYGPARFVILFLVSGIGGYLVSVGATLTHLWGGAQLTAGASGALFGLIGATIAFATRRGGQFGEQLRRVGVQWLVYGLVFGFVVPNINNWAHGGGAAFGFACAWFFDPNRMARGRESDGVRLLALALLVLCAVAFVLALVTGYTLR